MVSHENNELGFTIYEPNYANNEPQFQKTNPSPPITDWSSKLRT